MAGPKCRPAGPQCPTRVAWAARADPRVRLAGALGSRWRCRDVSSGGHCWLAGHDPSRPSDLGTPPARPVIVTGAARSYLVSGRPRPRPAAVDDLHSLHSAACQCAAATVHWTIIKFEPDSARSLLSGDLNRKPVCPARCVTITWHLARPWDRTGPGSPGFTSIGPCARAVESSGFRVRCHGGPGPSARVCRPAAAGA
jgi:hypothetical protein